MSTEPDSSARHVPGRDPDDFIATWAEAGGSEQANAQSFVIDLCHLLDVEPPRPAQEDNAKNDYVFERGVYFKHPDGTRTPGRIDCYKRDCFILEAKQSAKRERARRAGADTGLFPPEQPAALRHSEVQYVLESAANTTKPS